MRLGGGEIPPSASQNRKTMKILLFTFGAIVGVCLFAAAAPMLLALGFVYLLNKQ
jgi:hypothetical protein